ncbi:MAG: DHH family phosphoesterase [Bacteroidota bacterium]|uniref:DHH family phosphoesterase n=1 Tax=Nonlabens tegetincola TaxID=323273 RepID=UPI002E8DAA9A|nr:DHH family phosphoesterase [Bacteroidota bacterium]
MNEQQITALKKELSHPKKIVIVPHKGPDGDAIGSITSLYEYLIQLNHQVHMISPNDFPDFLKWMAHTEQIINYEKDSKLADSIIKEADLIFSLDHNALHRTGEMQTILEESTASFVMIDHHQQPDPYATYMYSDTGMSSTCQMMYHFFEMMDHVEYITPSMAASMYTGILTDTGSFKYRSTTSTTLRVAAALVDKGADAESINRNIYDANSVSRLKLLGVALNNMTVLSNYRTAFITLTQQELDDNGFKKGDTEGFVNYALSLKDVVFAQIFIQKADEGIIKTSLRSKGNFDVNTLARKHWNGGGHLNAAGGKSDLDMKATVDKLISILPQYEEELVHTAI